MDRLAFNASAAITEMRLARQALANEMANMSTTGFKRSYEVSLKAFKAEGEGFDSNYQPQAVHMDFIKLAPGPLMATGRDLDILMNDQTDGGVFIHDPNQPGIQQETQIGQLLLRDASKTPLTRREDALFQAHDKPTGADFASGPVKTSVTTQALEGSNVSPTEAMVKLIEQSRMFEQQVRMVKASHENDQSGSSMLKLSS